MTTDRIEISEGATEDSLLDAYPRLQREDIRAAIEWFECRLPDDPRFLKRIEDARQSFAPVGAFRSKMFLSRRVGR